MDKQQFLHNLRTERARWDSLLAQFPPDDLTRFLDDGRWTIKDLIAHVSWYEREMVGVLQAAALQGSEWWALAPDERNAAIYEANREREIADVLSESRRVFENLLRELDNLVEEALHDASYFVGMPEEWRPWEMIAENSYAHYKQHTPQLRACLPQPDSFK